MTRRIPQQADIFRAALIRLAPHRDRLQADLATVTAWLDKRPSGDNIAEDDPGTLALLKEIRIPSDRRCQWGRFVALLALVYLGRKDSAAFALVGHELLLLERQSQRRRSRRGTGDALNNLVAAHLAEQPGRPTAAVIRDITGAAMIDPTIVDYDPSAGVLSYAQGEGVRDINRPALERRVQRTRKRMATQPVGG